MRRHGLGVRARAGARWTPLGGWIRGFWGALRLFACTAGTRVFRFSRRRFLGFEIMFLGRCEGSKNGRASCSIGATSWAYSYPPPPQPHPPPPPLLHIFPFPLLLLLLVGPSLFSLSSLFSPPPVSSSPRPALSALPSTASPAFSPMRTKRCGEGGCPDGAFGQILPKLIPGRLPVSRRTSFSSRA